MATELEQRMRSDLTESIRARDELTTATLRMTLAALSTEAVSGKTARELDAAEALAVVTREAKKRREAAEAFSAAGRSELADRERAEGEVLARYLPAQLTDEELATLVSGAVEQTGASGMKGMGAVMKVVTPQVAGRAEGSRVAAEVRKQLG